MCTKISRYYKHIQHGASAAVISHPQFHIENDDDFVENWHEHKTLQIIRGLDSRVHYDYVWPVSSHFYGQRTSRQSHTRTHTHSLGLVCLIGREAIETMNRGNKNKSDRKLMGTEKERKQNGPCPTSNDKRRGDKKRKKKPEHLFRFAASNKVICNIYL